MCLSALASIIYPPTATHKEEQQCQGTEKKMSDIQNVAIAIVNQERHTVSFPS